MKLNFSAAALAVVMAVPATAQERTVHESPRNREVYGRVVYESDEYGPLGRGDGWARRFAHSMVDGFLGSEYYVETDRDMPGGRNSEVRADVRDNVNGRDFSKSVFHFGPGHTPEFYIGLNVLAENGTFSQVPGLPQRVGKGYEWGFALGRWGYHMTNNVGMNTAVYLSRSRYWLSRDNYLDWDVNWNLALMNGEYEGKDVKQGYLRYWSLKIPFCLELSSSSRRGPFLAFGPELEWRFGDVSKVKLADGDKRKPTGDLNLNPLAVNLVARTGVDNFGIIVRYAVTELFQNANPVECYPFTVGISTSF